MLCCCGRQDWCVGILLGSPVVRIKPKWSLSLNPTLTTDLLSYPSCKARRTWSEWTHSCSTASCFLVDHQARSLWVHPPLGTIFQIFHHCSLLVSPPKIVFDREATTKSAFLWKTAKLESKSCSNEAIQQLGYCDATTEHLRKRDKDLKKCREKSALDDSVKTRHVLYFSLTS